MSVLHLSELVTDASSTIIKLVRDSKGQSNYPFEIIFGVHSAKTEMEIHTAGLNLPEAISSCLKME